MGWVVGIQHIYMECLAQCLVVLVILCLSLSPTQCNFCPLCPALCLGGWPLGSISWAPLVPGSCLALVNDRCHQEIWEQEERLMLILALCLWQ